MINKTIITKKEKGKKNKWKPRKTWIWVRKGNLKRETELLLITAENNAWRTDCVNAKIDKTLKIANLGDGEEKIIG